MCCPRQFLYCPSCLQGGKLTSPDQADIVHLVQMGQKQLLWYEAPPKVHAALLRGTTADLDGNISFEKEALYLDSLNMVRAALPWYCKALVIAVRVPSLRVWGGPSFAQTVLQFAWAGLFKDK